MRLLNLRTGRFELWADPREAHYAILSHVWDSIETSYEEICAVLAKSKGLTGFLKSDRLPPKLVAFFKRALEDGFDLAWADTCCIDKRDRSELVETMNSMFDWYGHAGACYVLIRVSNYVLPTSDSRAFYHGCLETSSWFRRGWTLQELLAPRIVLFFADDWTLLGSKHTLASRLAVATGIDRKVLTSQVAIDEFPMAQRMAWARDRCCTRVEDEAYSMMGILGVNLEIVYGEGGQAFFRLQVEALRRYPDQTLLAWGNNRPQRLDDPDHTSSIATASRSVAFGSPSCSVFPCRNETQGDIIFLAAEPSSFRRLGGFANLSPAEFTQKLGIIPPNRFYSLIDLVPDDPLTVCMTLPVFTVPDVGQCALVACEDSEAQLVVIPLRPLARPDNWPWYYSARSYLIPYDRLQSLGLTSQPPRMRLVYAKPHNSESPSESNSKPGAPHTSGQNDDPRMRILEVKYGRLKEEKVDARALAGRYAVLSHVWSRAGDGREPDQTYLDVQALQKKADSSLCGFVKNLILKKLGNRDSSATSPSIVPQLGEKLRQFCAIALEYGFEFGWADTCCIDKSNPNEVEESIAAMFNWYALSGACFVLLHDVKSTDWEETFSKSEWFERGWTLQELLAPRTVIFLSSDWKVIGTKANPAILRLITAKTRIPHKVLADRLTSEEPIEALLAEIPIAQRFSWAASRKTTRVEDLAYSMMDIVGVKIPVAYGEGLYAFIRLQEEALRKQSRHSDVDQTVFAWGRCLPSLTPLSLDDHSSPGEVTHAPTLSQFMLASSPREFQHASALLRISQREFAQTLGLAEHEASQTFTPTPHGIRARLPLLSLQLGDPSYPKLEDSHTHLALLSVSPEIHQWHSESQDRQFLALLLRPYKERGGPPEYLVGTHGFEISASERVEPMSPYTRTTFLSKDQLTQYSSKWVMTDVYIPHYPSRTMVDLEYNADTHDALRHAPQQFAVRLCRWSEKLLQSQGFALDSVPSPQDGFHVFTISRGHGQAVHMPGLERFRIHVGRCGCCSASQNLGPLTVHLELPSLQPRVGGQGSTALTHEMDHSDHVHSWSFSRGAAWKVVEPVAPGLDGGETPLLKLILTTAKPRSDTRTQDIRTYLLGVEIHDPSSQFPAQSE